MLFTLLAPEYILGKALGDRVVAECCKKRFKTVGINLTLTHVFYANMGGFVLTEQWPAFLSAQNIYRLRGIPCIKARISNIKTEELWDKSKQDILLKIVAVIQVFWMTLQIVVRVGKGLDISRLGLAVAAFCLQYHHLYSSHTQASERPSTNTTHRSRESARRRNCDCSG
jgi:hypothetical protein